MRCVTVLGPSHAGKTTLSEALAAIEPGGTAYTMASGLGVRSFRYLDEPWGLLDVPGGSDALAIAGPALAASDAAVLCVPPEVEHAVLAAPFLRLVEEADIPCFLFVNKVDASDARMSETVGALQAFANHAVVLRQVPIREDGQVTGTVDLISERAWEFHEGGPSSLIEIPGDIANREETARADLLEHLADFDDDLLEQLIEDRAPATEQLYQLIADVHRSNALIPACIGSASHRFGLHRLMKSLRHECPRPDQTAARPGLGGAIAVSVAAEHRKHVGKAVLLRALSGGLTQGGQVGGAGLGALAGLDGKPLPSEVAQGDLIFALRSDHLRPGEALEPNQSAPLPDWAKGPPPTYRRRVHPAHDRDETRLSGALAKLADVEAGVALGPDPDTGEPVLVTQGPVHLKRMTDMLADLFSVEVETTEPPPRFRETISARVEQQHRHRKQSGGAGQFADVSITVEPLPRGAGFTFSETVKGGAVPRNYIPAVEHGATDALSEGPLGFRVIDVAVTLTDGKHHAVDSSDHAFRLAGAAAMRSALKAAGPVLLQPIDRVTIHVPSLHSGSLVPMVSTLRGQVLGFEAHPGAKGWDVFQALVPASAHPDLLRSLMTATQGTAWYDTEFDHYQEMHGKEADTARAAVAEAAG